MSDDADYIKTLEAELDRVEQGGRQPSVGASALFNSAENENLIEFQLGLENILERMDHLLRGHVLKFDKEGNFTWQEPEDKSLQVFNEYGVQEILRILTTYLNRNTILSNYDEATIDWKVYDFSMDIIDLIFMKYEQMGLDDKEKIKIYPMIVRQLTDTVHSTYLRALNGGERESLRTARTVTQTEPLNQQPRMDPMGNQSKFSIWKPNSWSTSR